MWGFDAFTGAGPNQAARLPFKYALCSLCRRVFSPPRDMKAVEVLLRGQLRTISSKRGLPHPFDDFFDSLAPTSAAISRFGRLAASAFTFKLRELDPCIHLKFGKVTSMVQDRFGAGFLSVDVASSGLLSSTKSRQANIQVGNLSDISFLCLLSLRGAPSSIPKPHSPRIITFSTNASMMLVSPN